MAAMASPPRTTHHPDPARLVRLRRDAALERVRSVTKAIAVGSVAAAGAFGLYVSRALPGHASTPPPATTTPATTPTAPAGATTSTTTPGGQATSTTLSPPSAPPVRARARAPVVSGSS